MLTLCRLCLQPRRRPARRLGLIPVVCWYYVVMTLSAGNERGSGGAGKPASIHGPWCCIWACNKGTEDVEEMTDPMEGEE